MNTGKGIRMFALMAAGLAFAFTANAQSSTANPPSTTPPTSQGGTTTPPTAKGGTTTPPTSKSSHPTMPQVHQNDANRIANGVKSGQLTAGETAHLENHEAALNKEKSQMKAANNGKLTTADKQKLNSQYKGLSHQVYDAKHNSRSATYGSNSVGQTRQNQQARIAQGIQSGSLTSGEAAHMERQQHNANAKASQERMANGGRFTPAERHAASERQGRMSRNINHAKHNGRSAHGGHGGRG
jgi:hypothetical protein